MSMIRLCLARLIGASWGHIGIYGCMLDTYKHLDDCFDGLFCRAFSTENPWMRNDGALKALGKNMKVARVRKEWTQEQVADAAGVSRGYYAACERGQQNMSISSVLRFAKVLDVKLSHLCEGLDDK